MPFQSDRQRRWMYANEPEMAEKWQKEEKKSEEDEADEEQLTEKIIRQIVRLVLLEEIKQNGIY